MSSFESQVDKLFSHGDIKFTARSLEKIFELLEEFEWVKNTKYHTDPTIFVDHVWNNFSNKSNDNYTIGTALLLSMIIYDGGVGIQFEISEKLQSFLVRLIQIHQKNSSGFKMKSAIVKSITSLILNSQDPATKDAVTPLFSIFTWNDDIFQFIEPGIIQELGLRTLYDSEYDNISQLRGKPKAVMEILSSWIPDLLKEFIHILDNTTETITYLTQILYLFTTLVSQPSSRKFMKTLLDYHHVTISAQMKVINDEKYCNALDTLEHFLKLPVSDFTYTALTDEQVKSANNSRISKFQGILYQKFPDGNKFENFLFGDESIFDNIGVVEKELKTESTDDIKKILEALHIPLTLDNSALVPILVDFLTTTLTPSQILSRIPIFPNLNIIRSSSHEQPKNNNNCFSIEDRIIREFFRYRDSSFQIIKEHVKRTLLRFEKRKGNNKIQGHSKYAVRVNIQEPLSQKSSNTIASNYCLKWEGDINIELSKSPSSDVDTWNSIKKSDIIALVEIQEREHNTDDEFKRIGVKDLKTATVNAVKSISRNPNANQKSKSFVLDLRFDSVDFSSDTAQNFKKFNILIRFPENLINLHSDLALIQKTTKDLTLQTLPKWFIDVLFDKPNIRQTHLNKNVDTANPIERSDLDSTMPYREEPLSKKRKITNHHESLEIQRTFDTEGLDCPCDIQLNCLQLKCLTESNLEGLTLINGSSGTGKKTLAAHISNSLFRNHGSKTLIISKSSTALVNIFSNKALQEQDIMTLIDEPDGAVVWDKITKSLGQLLNEGDTLSKFCCDGEFPVVDLESAELFYNRFLLPKWVSFLEKAKRTDDMSIILKEYPFRNAPGFEDAVANASHAPQLLRQLLCNFQDITKWYTSAVRYSVISNPQLDGNAMLSVIASSKAIVGVTLGALFDEVFSIGYGHFENIIISEAADISLYQILRILTIFTSCKRLIFLGDLGLCAPLSLFKELITKNCGRVDLKQIYGRRKEIASLLHKVEPEDTELPTFNTAVLRPIQFIKVDTPNPDNGTTFSQSLEEAEYLIEFYRYLLSRGYQAKQIAIVSPCESQVALMKEICHAKISRESKPSISTISDVSDEREIVICSFATDGRGHFDRSELYMLTSMARLGLYMFGSPKLIQLLETISNGFKSLVKDGTDLQIVPDETIGDTEKRGDHPRSTVRILNMGQLSKFTGARSQ